MKRGWVFLCLLVTVFAFSSVAKANLTVIGHANYLGNNFKLIFDNAQGLVWLDFSNEPCEGESCNSWEEQMQWAEELNGEGILTYNLNPGISISWKGDWRLPITDEGPVNMDLEPDEIFGWEGPDQEGYYDYHAGFNLLNSELGYLYYISLGNSACYNPEKPADPYWQCYSPHIEPPNTEPFDNLSTLGYWSGTKYSPVPVSDGASWNFNFSNGDQGPGKDDYQWGAYGIAVRPAHVFNLQVIGTATYQDNDYNLIYDKAQGLVWLDFTNPKENAQFWDDQIAWTGKLNDKNVLTENLLSGFNIVWGGPWRLPETDESKVSLDEGSWGEYDSDNPGYGWGGPLSDGTYDYLWGYNMINSEMGYLYYVLLENLGNISIEGVYNQPGWGLQNTGPFLNLRGDVYYWSGTESSIDSNWAWYFSTGDGGSQGAIQKNWDPDGGWLNTAALAVRPAHVPIPTYTNEGENVTVVEPINHGDTKSTATITFYEVEAAGDTTLYILPVDENTPDGFDFGDFVFDIETTADFSGSVTVCINNPNVNESTRLWHRKCDNGNECNWVNVTLYPIEGETICGQVDSFSLFAIGEYSAKNAIDILIGDVKSLNINKGIENSLIKKLEAANSSLNRNRKNAAANQLGAFINQINGLKVKKISEGAASELIRKAEDIIFYL